MFGTLPQGEVIVIVPGFRVVFGKTLS